jgi:hypothetical protein
MPTSASALSGAVIDMPYGFSADMIERPVH